MPGDVLSASEGKASAKKAFCSCLPTLAEDFLVLDLPVLLLLTRSKDLQRRNEM